MRRLLRSAPRLTAERGGLGQRWAQSAPSSVAAGIVTTVAPLFASFSSHVIPTGYLVRPLVAAVAAGVLIGALAALSGRYAVLVSIAASLLLFVPEFWPIVVLLVGADVLVQGVQRLRHRPAPQPGRFALTIAVVLLLLGVAQSAPLVLKELTVPPVSGINDGGTPVYLVLLDGYPRIDSLQELGIDNEPFIDELATRGFDHYPEASSAHGYTNLTLADMFAGEVVGPSDDDPIMNTTEWNQGQRFNLRWPQPYYVLDPPVSHAVTIGGSHWYGGGITDFEASLLGRSVFATAQRDLLAGFIADSLRSNQDATLDELASTDASSVFAHLFSPHPPFLYVEDLPRCWPHSCGVFDSWIESTGITMGVWTERMRGQLNGLNSDLLATIDRITERHPDAAIVLFSDHGARYSLRERGDEWHATFLAARTPGHPRLFNEEAEPSAVLRLITDAYR